MLNDLLAVLTQRVDHVRVIQQLRKAQPRAARQAVPARDAAAQHQGGQRRALRAVRAGGGPRVARGGRGRVHELRLDRDGAALREARAAPVPPHRRDALQARARSGRSRSRSRSRTRCGTRRSRPRPSRATRRSPRTCSTSSSARSSTRASPRASSRATRCSAPTSCSSSRGATGSSRSRCRRMIQTMREMQTKVDGPRRQGAQDRHGLRGEGGGAKGLTCSVGRRARRRAGSDGRQDRKGGGHSR